VILFQEGMHVRKEDSPADPAYPDAKEFLKNRATLGAAILGAGMALGGCADTGRTGGVPVRTGGVVAVPGPKTEPFHPMGKFKIEPKPEPPPLPGSPPMVPPNPEH
jgi:hypothetical protein